jgi:plastocyanin
MHITLSRILIAGIATAVVGCSDVSMPTTSSAPSTLRADRSSNDRTKTVRIMDECDPGTFNAVLGNGACQRNGGMKFDQFNAQLAKLQLVPGWRFSPDNVTLRVGDVLAATNFGGERHTFTEVEDFGGGFVPALNAASGLTHVAPECAALSFADALAPGATFSETTDEAGDEKYQCCIHPWMRAVVHIAAK